MRKILIGLIILIFLLSTLTACESEKTMPTINSTINQNNIGGHVHIGISKENNSLNNKLRIPSRIHFSQQIGA